MSEDTRPKCPRCTRPMHDRMVRNALSRVDNKTYICNGCGRDEAMFGHYNPKGTLTPLDQLVFPTEKTRPEDISNPPLVIPAEIADQIPAGANIATLGERLAEREAREVEAAFRDAGISGAEYFE